IHVNHPAHQHPITFLRAYLETNYLVASPTYTIHFTSAKLIKLAYSIPEMSRYTDAAMQKAMQYARSEPDIPILRLAQLYSIDKTTLGRRVKGKQEGWDFRSLRVHTHDAIFAVSPSGYMDNELGLEYIKHFNTHTRHASYKQQVYTIVTITAAFRASGYWPIDILAAHGGLPLPLPPSETSTIMIAQSKTTTLNIRALDTPIRLRTMASNIEVVIPELTISSKLLLHIFVDAVTQVVAEYRDINPHAITLNKLRNGKVHKRTGKRHLGMARVMDRKTVDVELKEIAQKKVEAAAAEKAKLARKKEATAKKIIKEQAIQQKKAICEAQAVLEAQWNAEYTAAEASWRLERDQAHTEYYQKPPRKPVKLPRPKAVGMGSADSAEEGAEDLEQASNAIIEAVQDIEAIDDQDTEELADRVRELEITEFSNMVN
ncbi:hypothetical protein EV426DRAFT_660729, partial [Tirmania nivea]